MDLDARAPGALTQRFLSGPRGRGGREVARRNILQTIRDRVVHQSQIGKLKLDRAAIRRELDRALRELGERYSRLARTGGVDVPAGLADEMGAVRKLEERMAAQDREIAALEEDHPGAAK
jgi:hypothetical protein